MINQIDMEWISLKEKLPDFEEDIEISYDGGKTVECEAIYLERRTCMMAGIAGGVWVFRGRIRD